MKRTSLLVCAAFALFSCKLSAADSVTATTTPPASPAAKSEATDLTGEAVADMEKALASVLGTPIADADAEPPPAPEIPVLNRVIYVSPTALNSGKGLTPDSPVSPIRASYMSLPGDVILFAEGEYIARDGKPVLIIERSGEAGSPIVYSPAPGAKVTLRVKDSWDAIKVNGASHIVIRNFRVVGSSASVTPDEAVREMSNLKNPRTCGNGISIIRNGAKESPTHVTVKDCVVSDFPGGGIFANHCDYITFENNVVFRCAFWSPYGNSGISIYQPIDVDDVTDYKIIIRNNVSFGNYQNIPFFFSNRTDPSKRKWTDGNGIILDDFLNSQSWGGGSGKPYKGRTLVANNVVFANGGSGIHTYKANHVDIIQNYAANNNRHPMLKDGQLFANNSKDIRILNNILIAPPGKPVTSSNKNEGLEQNFNLYANLDGSAPQFPGDQLQNVVAVPGLELIDWAQGKRDFTVTADSPLRGAGLTLPDPTPDFFGKPRGNGKPDIGPFVLEGR